MTDSLNVVEVADEQSILADPGLSTQGQKDSGVTKVTTDNPDAVGLIARLRERDKPLLASGEPAHGPG